MRLPFVRMFNAQPLILVMLTQRDKIFGAVLRRSVRDGIIQKVSEADDHPGHFIVDGSKHVLVKHAQSSSSTWRFSFSPEVIETLVSLQSAADLFGGAYLWLVCDNDAVCELSVDEWSSVLNVDAPASQQTIRIARPPGHSFSVTGSAGSLGHSVPVSRFPSLGA